MRTRQKSGFPRVACVATGCRRGTTRIEPDENGRQGEWICGPHWRTVPKNIKDRMKTMRRRYRLGERKGSQLLMTSASQVFWAYWAEARRFVQGEELETVDGVPAGMAEALRRDCLI